jgi:hypothetical protein
MKVINDRMCAQFDGEVVGFPDWDAHQQALENSQVAPGCHGYA